MELGFYHKRMEYELKNFMMLWLIVLLSLCYCYVIGNKISKGIKRLLFVLPIIVIFMYLPLNLYSFHLNFLTFYAIAWLCNSKLLLFAFGNGPLSSDPSMPIPVFLAVASLPIKLQQKPPLNIQNKEHPSTENPKNVSPILIYAIKGPLLAIVVYITTNYSVYITTNYSVYIHQTFLSCIACLQYYLQYEMTLALISALAGALLGLELEPTFNEPYLSTSLQNFWGRRWNLMASNILRLTVHQPTKKMFARVLGHRWATPLAVMVTFSASGLIHELMFYYLLRVKPTGEATCYFLIHGMCVVVEIELKKKFKKWNFPWLISVLLTLGFVLVTTSWPFFSPMKRCKAYVRALHEYEAVAALFNDAILCFGIM
ncbi:hypothetical protein LWI28_015321 [Acer negundo]|uniref:Wax synthase domain-containing protein n=1 Tax=Acer negundo TaxID=4023 RepID=A0AAD5ILU6_ACENE|nr:hypothetical protein LWI28_015321 [Acer negundo]